MLRQQAPSRHLPSRSSRMASSRSASRHAGRLTDGSRTPPLGLAELPKQIEALQAEIAELQSTLADSDLYRRDANVFQAKTRASRLRRPSWTRPKRSGSS